MPHRASRKMASLMESTSRLQPDVVRPFDKVDEVSWGVDSLSKANILRPFSNKGYTILLASCFFGNMRTAATFLHLAFFFSFSMTRLEERENSEKKLLITFWGNYFKWSSCEY